jgi:hypothetical protein
LPALETTSVETSIGSRRGKGDCVAVWLGCIFYIYVVQFEIGAGNEECCCQILVDGWARKETGRHAAVIIPFIVGVCCVGNSCIVVCRI